MKLKILMGMAATVAVFGAQTAAADMYDAGMTHNGALIVATPFSPNESGPAERHETLSYGPIAVANDQRIVTPLADNEAGPHDFTSQAPDRLRTSAASSAMPNPHTPWSVSESGADSYADHLAAREQQLVEFEQARIAAAEWNAQVAAYEAAAAEGQPAFGATAGSGVGLTLEGPTVGVLEAPAATDPQLAWNVEPLTPNADLTSGQTVVILPGNADTVVMIPAERGYGQADTAGSL